MATGITKGEQCLPDEISAFDSCREPQPLPEDGVSVSLSYTCKISEEKILQKPCCKFLQIIKDRYFEINNISQNSFILADNFFTLGNLYQSGKKVDLFYLDPPYGTGFDFYSRDLRHAYSDNLGLAAYLEFMRRRLILMRECMASDGSIYVHIGHQMLAHLKVLMDEIFGNKNFRNLITRRKCSSKNFTVKQYANLNDFILFYSKGPNYKWNQPGIEPEQNWIEREYPKIDEIGRRFKLVPIHAPGKRNGETGEPWRDMLPPPGKHWQYAPRRLEKLDRQGDIHWSRNGNPRRKVYWFSEKKVPLTDYWSMYRDAHHQSIKITGYPTEKNFEMIKMIIKASSNEGDFVVDPFSGSGATMHAARDLCRMYLGIDSSFSAAKASLQRMRHGLHAMGDYVNGNESVNLELPLNQQDNEKRECDFIVDSRLYDQYRSKILEIERI